MEAMPGGYRGEELHALYRSGMLPQACFAMCGEHP